jgi:hypothetical protein
MNELLSRILDAHGGTNRWNGYHNVEATIVTEVWREGPETWRVLRAYFPGSVETHSLIQDLFFGEDLLLRRHDYGVNGQSRKIPFGILPSLVPRSLYEFDETES